MRDTMVYMHTLLLRFIKEHNKVSIVSAYCLEHQHAWHGLPFSIDVGATVVINDYHNLRGEEGREELNDSHVGCACSDCNGSTICIYQNFSLTAMLDNFVLHIMKGSHASMDGTVTSW